MADIQQDTIFMKRALDLSLLASGRTSPNPLVGCVIVREGQIVGEGYHAKAGTPHAEVNALQAAGEKAAGADVYVTLEPCSHFGRTPPCADALIKAGVRRVCIATTDPNPLVNGQGITMLSEAGIIIDVGILAAEAQKINEAFNKAVISKMPFVLYKCALTLDGKTAVDSGDSKWITSVGARNYAHELRNTFDVIMVGIKTVLHDDPLLTCRIDGGRDPVRLIVDSALSIPLTAKVLTASSSICIIATTGAADQDKLEKLKMAKNVEVLQYDSDQGVPLTTLMKDIAGKGLNSILLEGGGILAGKMLEKKLIDKIEFIFAPKLAGSGPSPLSGLKLSRIADAIEVKNTEINEIDGNYRFTGYLEY